MLSTQRLLSSTDVQAILGISREGFRKLRQRGAAPKAERCGSVSVTPVSSFIDFIARELARATRPRWIRRLSSMTVYVWRGPFGRWFALTPGKFGTSGATREGAIAEAREWSSATLRVVNSTPPCVSR